MTWKSTSATGLACDLLLGYALLALEFGLTCNLHLDPPPFLFLPLCLEKGLAGMSGIFLQGNLTEWPEYSKRKLHRAPTCPV